MTQVTDADVYEAALQWFGEKERETSLDDIRYFQENWSALPGLRSRVEALALARHREAVAPLNARITELEAALRGLLEMPGDVDAECNPPELQQQVLAKRREAWATARAALKEIDNDK